MISADALDELAGFAARGQLGYGVDLRCSDLNPEADSVVTLEWDFDRSGCMHGVLEITEVGRFRVPPVGRHLVNVGFAPISVQLMVGGEAADFTINPRIVAPHVHVRVPAQVTLGEPFRLTWQSNAETCLVHVTDGESIQEMAVGPAGGIEIQAHSLGELSVEISAFGRHARFSPAGATRQEVRIRVVPPPVRIVLDSNEKTAFIGDEVAFGWRVSGAHCARIVAVDRGESFVVPLQGEFVVEADCEPERFRLIATGLGGDEVIREFCVIPRLLDLDSTPEELKQLINQHWE